MHDDFDCDDVHVELGELAEDFKPIVSSILMPTQLCAFKSIPMPNDLDEKIKIEWEILKVQPIVNKKTLVLHYRLFFP
jgi:hypothetical protein